MTELDWERQSYVLAAFLPFVLCFFSPLLCLPWIAWLAWFIYRQWVAPKFLAPDGKAVLVTGCDSGFGQAVALELDLRGLTVFAGCLFPDGQGAQELQAQASNRLQILDLDITKPEKVADAVETIEEYLEKNHLKGLWGLYNNAGVSLGGEVEWTPLSDYRRAMEVNVFGTMGVTKAVLPLVRRARGRVVTITSGIARCAAAARSGYCVSKYALEGFQDCLRYEMDKFGVKVVTIAPGNLAGSTQIFQSMERCLERQIAALPPPVRADYGEEYISALKESILGGYRGQGSAVPIEPVVENIVHALLAESPRVRYKAAQYNWFLWWFLYNMLPEDLSDLYIRWSLRALPKPARIG